MKKIEKTSALGKNYKLYYLQDYVLVTCEGNEVGKADGGKTALDLIVHVVNPTALCGAKVNSLVSYDTKYCKFSIDGNTLTGQFTGIWGGYEFSKEVGEIGVVAEMARMDLLAELLYNKVDVVL